MLPTSHTAPRNGTGTALLDPPAGQIAGAAQGEAILLAGAFSEFIAAAGRLEASYGELQQQVAELSRELAQRNAALNASLAENEGMRLALQQIVDSMPCGVLVLERDGALSMINPEGLRLLAVSGSEARSLASLSAHTGIDLSSFVDYQKVRHGQVAGSVRTAHRGGTTRHDLGLDLGHDTGHDWGRDSGREFSLVTAGIKRWIEIRTRQLPADPLLGDQPKQVATKTGEGRYQTILILRDVTAHKLAEQERERGRRATALAELAAMLAHEIRNPLASMELFAGLLADSKNVLGSSGPELQWISHMRAGIRSLAATVNNVLNYHGADALMLAPLDLAVVIGSSVGFARPIAEQAGVTLDFFAEPAAERAAGQVLGNASALQQLVLNLVANAVRHTPRGGRVRVAIHAANARCEAGASSGTACNPPRIQLDVADTGSGIHPEHLSEIFRAGFSASGHSSGLGLAVCKQIVRQHQGEIRVTSVLAAGTTFSVELPTL